MRIAFTAPKQEDMSWMGVFAWGPHFGCPFLGPLSSSLERLDWEICYRSTQQGHLQTSADFSGQG